MVVQTFCLAHPLREQDAILEEDGHDGRILGMDEILQRLRNPWNNSTPLQIPTSNLVVSTMDF